MIDELRFKNALRCQIGEGIKKCKHCPYYIENDKCDVKLLFSHAIEYIKYAEKAFADLYDRFVDEYKR